MRMSHNYMCYELKNDRVRSSRTPGFMVGRAHEEEDTDLLVGTIGSYRDHVLRRMLMNAVTYNNITIFIKVIK